MAKKATQAKKPLEKVMNPAEVEAMMIQHKKDSALPSLLYVTRKLGEVEGLISLQTDPDVDLVSVQKDLKRVYGKLVEEAGVELEPKGVEVYNSIGRDVS